MAAESFFLSSTDEAVFRASFPAHYACMKGEVQVLSSILKSPESILMEESVKSWTLVHFAAYFGQLDCIRQLATVEPSIVNIQSSKNYQSALHSAAEGGQAYCALWLVHTGANPNLKDILGETALHKAARVGSAECVQLLLSVCSCISAQNVNGQSAYDIAAAQGNSEICALIRQHEPQVPSFETRVPNCRRKRFHDEDIIIESAKRMKPTELNLLNQQQPLSVQQQPTTIGDVSPGSSFEEHMGVCQADFGYNHTLLYTLLSEYHGC